MGQGPLPAFPRGLPKGHEAWAFGSCQARVWECLADCPDHAEGPDSQGPTQGIGASLVPSPWHNAVRREKFREAVHRGGGRPPEAYVCGLVVGHLVHGRLHVQIVGRTAHVEGGFKCQGTVAEHLGVSVS